MAVPPRMCVTLCKSLLLAEPGFSCPVHGDNVTSPAGVLRCKWCIAHAQRRVPPFLFGLSKPPCFLCHHLCQEFFSQSLPPLPEEDLDFLWPISVFLMAPLPSCMLYTILHSCSSLHLRCKLSPGVDCGLHTFVSP